MGMGAFGVLLACLITMSANTGVGEETPLDRYVSGNDGTFRWERLAGKNEKGEDTRITWLRLTSQQWRSSVWEHDLAVVSPKSVSQPETAFLWITNDSISSEEMRLLKTVADRAGAIAVGLTDIPNQPLFDGLSEDALIAFTFEKFFKSKDPSWPLLFPMTKGAVRAMDAVQAFSEQQLDQSVERFVVSGASKRGWTAYLTAAVDPRVTAMAPVVFEMLDMQAQTKWAKATYGKQSDKIHDYTERGLVEKLDHKVLAQLREWVDPIAYQERYTMPKLIILGTNDPYWVVDSSRHYWDRLPSPKWMHQTPNAGHDLADSRDAIRTLAEWYRMIASSGDFPKLRWQFSRKNQHGTRLTIESEPLPKRVLLWTSRSTERDFRNAKWESETVAISEGKERIFLDIEPPADGYKAFFAQLAYSGTQEGPYHLSTEVRVVPDDVP